MLHDSHRGYTQQQARGTRKLEHPFYLRIVSAGRLTSATYLAHQVTLLQLQSWSQLDWEILVVLDRSSLYGLLIAEEAPKLVVNLSYNWNIVFTLFCFVIFFVYGLKPNLLNPLNLMRFAMKDEFYFQREHRTQLNHCSNLPGTVPSGATLRSSRKNRCFCLAWRAFVGLLGGRLEWDRGSVCSKCLSMNFFSSDELIPGETDILLYLCFCLMQCYKQKKPNIISNAFLYDQLKTENAQHIMVPKTFGK